MSAQSLKIFFFKKIFFSSSPQTPLLRRGEEGSFARIWGGLYFFYVVFQQIPFCPKASDTKIILKKRKREGRDDLEEGTLWNLHHLPTHPSPNPQARLARWLLQQPARSQSALVLKETAGAPSNSNRTPPGTPTGSLSPPFPTLSPLEAARWATHKIQGVPNSSPKNLGAPCVFSLRRRAFFYI